MDQLPVTKLSYGDDSNRYQWIKYELGHLRCFGKKGYYPSEGRYQPQIDTINGNIAYISQDIGEIKIEVIHIGNYSSGFSKQNYF